MRNIKTLILPEIILIIILCFGTVVSSAQPLIKQPAISSNFIKSGEKLEYRVKIRGITAGDQTLQINTKKLKNGREVYHVKSESKVRSFFSIFYPFSNRSESLIQRKNHSPLHYKKQIRDGGYTGNIDIRFDWDKQVARVIKDSRRTEIDIPPGVQDELSMIYLLRVKKMEVGEEYEFPVLTGDKTLKTKVRVLRTERLKTILGSLDTIVVNTVPKNVTIWLSKDSSRIPVKIEAPTKIGKLVSYLKAISR